MTKKSGFSQHCTPHTTEFSRRAHSYKEYNIIQKAVAKKLVSSIDTKPKSILDLGCGSGAVYELIEWEVQSFTGIDKADQMCKLHPKADHIRLLHEDFENLTLLERLGKFDMVISASAIQWAKDRDALFRQIAKMADEIAFAIFTDGTFRTIYEMTKMKRFLPEKNQLIKQLENYFDIVWEVENYRLEFPDNLSKFRYIKHSGVSGGTRKLSVKQTRDLIRDYPHSYLEFEVLFCKGKVK
jgi:malonyl-CoA O-methyltransferase